MDREVVPAFSPSREKVLQFEAALRAHAEATGSLIDADQLTRHLFSPGIYAREMVLPAGTCATGKIHRHAHIIMVSAGRISLLTEHGIQVVEAPYTAVSQPGIKRVAFAHTDAVVTCIHANPDDCTDLTTLEARHIAPTFEELGHMTKPELLEAP